MSVTRGKRGALFLRCTEEEAERIRHAAISERRTVSGCILNAVLNRIEAREKLLREADNRAGTPKAPLVKPRIMPDASSSLNFASRIRALSGL